MNEFKIIPNNRTNDKKWTFDKINGTIIKMIAFHGIKLRTILILIVNKMCFIKQLLWSSSEGNKKLIGKK